MVNTGKNITTKRFTFLLVSLVSCNLTSLASFVLETSGLYFLEYGMLSIITWAAIIIILLVIYHKNQQSTYLKYAVLGRVFCTEFKRDVRTRRDVTDPINLLLKFSSCT